MPGDPFGLIGQVLDGQFRVDKFVGEGGFSIVYKGHHLGLNEPIAIKCLKLPTALGSALVESFVRRFRDESRLHYRLSQGNLAIARSIASGTTMSPSTSALVPYMVLEWLEGRSMAQDFEVRRQWGKTGRSLEDAMRLFDSAAQGLAYAHAQGVIHRDVNPGNLFLAQIKQGDQVREQLKVLDFGVAKIVSDHALEMGPRAQTIGHIRIFAPAYGAPEQFDESLGAIGPQTDVYALTLIFLEALRDKPVRDGEHLGEFAMKALDPDVPTPRRLGIAVGDAVEAVLARAVARSPADRPADVGTMWGMLKNAIQADAASGRASGVPGVPVVPATARAGTGTRAFGSSAPPPPAPSAEAKAASEASAAGVSLGQAPTEPGVSTLGRTVRMAPEARPRAGESTEPSYTGPNPTLPLGATKPLHSTLVMPSASRPSAPMKATAPLGSTVPFGRGPAADGATSGIVASGPSVVSQMVASYGPAGAPAAVIPGRPREEASDAPIAPTAPPKSRGALILVALLVGLAVLGAIALVVAKAMSAKAESPAPPIATTAPPAMLAPAAASAAIPAALVETVDAAPIDAPVAAASEPSERPAAPSSAGARASSSVPSGPSSGKFDAATAKASLDVIDGILASCRRSGGKTGEGRVRVIFGDDGQVREATIDDTRFAGTPEGECVASRMQRARIAPFSGPPGVLVYTFHVPK